VITFELSEIWSIKIIHDWQDLFSSGDESEKGREELELSGYNASTEAQVGSQSTPNAEHRKSGTL
jgi:hypothetical protein